MTLKQKRNIDFVTRCLKRIEDSRRSGAELSVPKAVHATILGGASEYYTTFDKVYPHVVELLREPREKRSLICLTPRRKQLMHIANGVEDRMKANPGLRLTKAIVEELRLGKPPRFYFRLDHGLHIFHSITKCTVQYAVDSKYAAQ